MNRWSWPARCCLVAALGGVAWLVLRGPAATALRRTPASSPLAPGLPGATPAPAAATGMDAASEPLRLPGGGVGLRWLALGGGATPEMNSVSIEQDIGLAARALRGAGLILFAGGPNARDVQVLDARPRGDPLLRELAALLAPRGGRESSYRRSTLPVAAAASLEHVRQAVTQLASLAGEPLTVYLAGHGEQGEHARDNWMALWGGSELRVSELAEWLDGARRTVRVVVTTCFGGGFAELAFAAAKPAAGAAPAARCGFFATPPDLPATGCDPNPDRAVQDGYALHFFHALLGQDRDGRSLPLATLDLDRDGRISLLEAHTRVNLASRAADVPTTTSERWLDQVAPRQGPGRAIALPEQQAVVAALSTQTGVPARARAAHAALEALERAIDNARARRDEASADEERRAALVIAHLLARWPVLDDPWHPDFPLLVQREGRAIAAYLARSAEHQHYQRARRALDEAEDAYWQLREQAAPIERLTRALDYLERAARLRARGGRAWTTFERLRACERGLP